MPSQTPLALSLLKYGLSAGTALLVASLYLRLSTIRKVPLQEPIRSPRWDIDNSLSQEELDNLPYPPDIFPGGRDVESPYGKIRVFEWGPEDGRKVLFVPGISTPAMSLGRLAEELVKKGCRVMLYDLFGRGYSDTPADMPHDARLFITQILLVISSSALAWTAHPGFNLVGYSLGGGVSMSFTRYLPHLVESLTLIAPGGLIRQSHIGWRSKVLYSRGILPEFLLEYLVKRRLRPQARGPSPPDSTVAKDPDEAVGAEVPDVEGEDTKGDSDATGGDTFDNAVLSKRFPHISVASAVSWQIESHAGFIPAFMSSIRYAPIYNQHAVWAIVGGRLSEQNADSANKETIKRGLHRGQVLMILGATDPVLVAEEAIEDAKAVLGEGNVEIAVLEAGHELPITKSVEVAEVIWQFWTVEK